jgi:hypothetical protein
MKRNWQEITRLTQGEEFSVERIRLERSGIAIEGQFELPVLARLRVEDQVFVMAFVKSHGSIKEMERLFGVSYPTIKSRLNRIGAAFEGVEVNPERPSEVLDLLARGEISAAEALERIKG